MEDYSRERFVNLLEQHFSKVDGDEQRFVLRDLNNKEVADALDLDQSYFGSLLNPDRNTSYRTAIRRLLKYEERKNLKKQIEELGLENESLKRGKGELELENKKVQDSRGRYRLVCYGTAILAGIFAILYLLPIFADSNPGHSNLESQYVVRDAATLDKIMQWHGKMIRYQLAVEAIKLNARVKEIDTELTSQQQQQFIEKAKNIVKGVIREERIGLENLHFVNTEGVNIATILNKVAPHGSLFEPSDSLFSGGFANIAPHILSKQASVITVTDESIKEVRGVQHKLWDKMRYIMFPEIQ